jgi:HEAT repeat protein
VRVVLAAAAVLGALAPGGEQYRRWIDSLGDESVVVRDEAAARLRSAGRSAWPDLETAGRSHPDPETRVRARELLGFARLRRRLSFRVLEEAPSAVAVLQGGPSCEKIRLIRVLSRHFEEAAELLPGLLRDPDPEVAVAAAEALYENRNADWGPRLLELYLADDCPRSGRIHELLCSASSRLPPGILDAAWEKAGPRARPRLLLLAVNANLPAAVPPEELRALLRDGDAADRRAALSFIRDRGAAGTLLEIEPLLDAPEPSTVAEALAALRQLRHRPDPERLGRLLRHDDPRVREEAAQTAAAFEERACLEGLRALLRDPSTSVRQTALAGYAKIEGPAALETAFEVLLSDGGDTRDQAASLLTTPANRLWAAPRARVLVAEPEAERRLRGYDLLHRIEGPSALYGLSRDPEESVRRWAIGQILRKVDGPGAAEALEGFAKDSSGPIRFEAVRALFRMGRKEYLPALEAFLSGPEYTLKVDAAETVLEKGGEAAEALARQLVVDPDGGLRRLGLGALADRADRSCADQALAALSDADGRLRRTAAHYLGKLLAGGKDPELLARLAASLESAEEEPLALAFRLVLEHGNASAVPAVRSLLASGRAPSADRAVRAIALWSEDRAAEELAPLLADDAALNDSVFARLKDARRPTGGPPVLAAALVRLLRHADPRVRRSAVLASEDLRLGGEFLAPLVEDPSAAVRHAAAGACARLGLAADAVEARLDDEDPEVRILAATLLPKLRPASIPAVERAVASEDCAWAKRRMELTIRTR